LKINSKDFLFLDFMLKNYLNKNLVEAGCDEAGRGCLAGPVVAAAVILPFKCNIKLLNDSKQVKEKDRYALREEIQEKAIAWAYARVEADEIDKINILQASIVAMHRSLDQFQLPFEHILVDGNKFKKYKSISHTCVIKGDAKFKSIAAASILAKTYRDDIMHTLHEDFPNYNWLKNKGYPTLEHRKAIRDFGICNWHRKTFNAGIDQLSLDFE
jgi:ribonuclease HII